MSEEMVPIRKMTVTMPEDPDRVPSWREVFFLLAGAVLEIGKALHRVADVMENRPGGAS